jgi:hypothetical protein
MALFLTLFAVLCQAATPPATLHPTRQQLIGAWRLVRIEVAGANGPITDPFYQADSSGLLIYDPSGWMSVQISAPHRVGWPVPAARSADPVAQDEPLKAAAFDTYYAYFATWTLDAAASVVTHHVASSLLPAENGRDYAQTIALVGDRLIFRGQDVINGERAVRTKVWERDPPHFTVLRSR